MDTSLGSYLSVPHVLAFMLVFSRIGGMIGASPLMQVIVVPPNLMIGLTAVVSLLLCPLVANGYGLFGQPATQQLPTHEWALAVLIGQELMIGLLLGFSATLAFHGIRYMGTLLGLQMGLSVASQVDPATGGQNPVVGQWYLYLGLIVFMMLNLHHWLLVAVAHSFGHIPLGQVLTEKSWGLLAERFIQLTADLFVTALMVGLPVLGVLLVVEVALAFMAKVMPQMNVFMVSMPLKVAIGLGMMAVTLPTVVEAMARQDQALIKTLMGLFQAG
ncbi:MAG: flagellar biosynthetic protein FliR [Candidatus Melainabacteria bacterium]|nr:flagellar biosynthetic protein FliR [Candidatus Melainabacteria bacterium]